MRVCGPRLKAARLKAGLNHVQLAVAAGYASTQRIYQLELNGGIINDNIGKAIAKAMCCSVTDFNQIDCEG